MKPTLLTLVLLGIAGLGSFEPVRAQELPTAQPKFLRIFREHVKAGRAAAHSKFEAAFPAAMEKAKSPDSYLAMSSLTGPSEVWYVTPAESHAAIAESMKREAKDPVFSAEMDRLGLADAEYISGGESILAVARPDLSMGTFPDMSKVRFSEITTMRVRPGRGEQFEQVAKAYIAAAKRANPKASSRVYQVLAGMPGETYLIFSSMSDYGEFDQRLSDSVATMKGATAEELTALRTFPDIIESTENNHFRIDPAQSYVSKEVRAKDPEFWMPK